MQLDVSLCDLKVTDEQFLCALQDYECVVVFSYSAADTVPPVETSKRQTTNKTKNILLNPVNIFSSILYMYMQKNIIIIQCKIYAFNLVYIYYINMLILFAYMEIFKFYVIL